MDRSKSFQRRKATNTIKAAVVCLLGLVANAISPNDSQAATR